MCYLRWNTDQNVLPALLSGVKCVTFFCTISDRQAKTGKMWHRQAKRGKDRQNVAQTGKFRQNRAKRCGFGLKEKDYK